VWNKKFYKYAYNALQNTKFLQTVCHKYSSKHVLVNRILATDPNYDSEFTFNNTLRALT